MQIRGRLPAKFAGDWCVAEHTADHLTFYRRGRCANPEQDVPPAIAVAFRFGST
jgi:hypothetical protein